MHACGPKLTFIYIVVLATSILSHTMASVFDEGNFPVKFITILFLFRLLSPSKAFVNRDANCKRQLPNNLASSWLLPPQLLLQRTTPAHSLSWIHSCSTSGIDNTYNLLVYIIIFKAISLLFSHPVSYSALLSSKRHSYRMRAGWQIEGENNIAHYIVT